MELNEITENIIGCAMKVHTALGPGLLEKTYEVCLEHEIRKLGMAAVRQLALPVVYDGIELDAGYRIDMLVENLVIVELKTVDRILPVHEAQLLSYLKLSSKKIGLLLNFNVARLVDGIKRVAN